MPAAIQPTDDEIRDYLAHQDIPHFVDQFVQAVIKKQPEDWRDVMLKMLDSVERTSRKGGGTKASALGGSGAIEYEVPEYCQRDPTMKPTAEQIKGKGVITNENTRPIFKLPQQMIDIHTTVAGRFNYAAAQCQAQCRLIQKQCTEAKKPFFDEKFWFGRRDAMYPKGSPPDCTVTEPSKAMRAVDLYPGAPLFSNGTGANDIIQGGVGDCFFIGAVSALACCQAQHLKPIERLFVFQDTKWGIYGVMLYKNGGWEWAIIDDWVAVQQDQKGQTWPQYASPGTEPELWPMLLEKAYAKIHYCWDTIDGGFLRSALEDLTGGYAFTLDLAKKDKKVYGTSPEKFQQLVDDPLVILGCSVGWHVKETGGGAGRAGEQSALGGLFKGHAYSVMQMKTCRDGKAFVRVRNPWGNDAEWTGAYGDRSPEWNRHPEYKRELNPEVKDDGAFWMQWEDFSAIFTDIDVVKFFRYDDVVFTNYGAAPETDFDPKNVFIVKVDKPCKATITLAQDDPLTKRVHAARKDNEMKTMMLTFFRLDRLPDRFDQLQSCFGEKVNSDPTASRTVSKEVELQPGHYAIVPRFRGAAGIGYYVRLVVAPTAEVAMWAWDEGPQSAMTVAGAKKNAAQVPAVGISDSHPEEGTTVISRQVTTEVASVSGGLSDAVIKSLGIVNKAKFDHMVSVAFNSADKKHTGALSKESTKVAFKYFISRQPKLQRDFFEAFDRTGKATLKPQEFQKVMDATLMALAGATDNPGRG